MSLFRRIPIAPPAAVAAEPAARVRAQAAVPVGDGCLQPGPIRIDGRKIHPSPAWKGKKPSESRGTRDDEPLVTTLADQAFRPTDQGGCPLAKA